MERSAEIAPGHDFEVFRGFAEDAASAETAYPPQIPPALVREQTEIILSSPMFDASERNRRFLRYIVEETLADRGARIKGYSIGISVFNRETRYDPQTDPVVRIEAGRLRRSLERFYLTDGRCAKIRISIPKGSYVPNFEIIEPAKQSTGTAGEIAAAPSTASSSVILLPFVSLCRDHACQVFTAGLNEELILEFGYRYGGTLFAPPAVPAGAQHSSVLEKTPAQLMLCGSVRSAGSQVRVVAHLVDPAVDQRLWSAAFDRSLKCLVRFDVEREIGHEICSASTPYCRRYAGLSADPEPLQKTRSERSEGVCRTASDSTVDETPRREIGLS